MEHQHAAFLLQEVLFIEGYAEGKSLEIEGFLAVCRVHTGRAADWEAHFPRLVHNESAGQDLGGHRCGLATHQQIALLSK